ncbi:hypothetical protein LIER_31493 [Lithospermum erythrorhizon]|uniref:Uncharacterized protein n=1 Tax=Lithospermum erythrorhizon TaxID=34254 RepID=A0AAV3RUQ4_LITER
MMMLNYGTRNWGTQIIETSNKSFPKRLFVDCDHSKLKIKRVEIAKLGSRPRIVSRRCNRSAECEREKVKILTEEAAPEIHNNYLPWVDYTYVLELDNPRPSLVNQDDDVGGEEFQGEISVEEDVIGKVTTPIVEEKVIDSSVADVISTADMLEPFVIPSVVDTTSKTTDSSLVSKKAVNVDGDNVPEGDSVELSHTKKTETEEVVMLSTEGLGVFIYPSDKDTLDGLKDSTPSGGDA